MKVTPATPIILLRCGILCAAALAAQLPSFGAAPAIADCEQLGRRLEASFAKSDIETCMGSFDWIGMMDRIMPVPAGGDASVEEMRAGFQKGFVESLRGQLRQFKGMKYLRVRQVGEEPRILVRLDNAAGAFNYWELIPGPVGRNGVKITDAFFYSAGEKLSDICKKMIIPVLAQKNKSLLQRLFTDTPDIVFYQSKWVEMGPLNSQGKYKEVLDLYNQLPASLQREKFILAQRLRAAQASDKREYLACLDMWQRAYPGDPSLDLISIDACVLRKEFPKALECIDRLDRSIGGDPFLDFQRALIYSVMKERDKAAAAAERGFEGDPSDIKMGFLAVALLVEDQKYDDAVAFLGRMESLGKFSKARLVRGVEAVQKFGEFRQSQVYLQWRGATPTAPLFAPAASPPGVRVQGIIYKPVGASATVNGKFVQVGDMVGDYKISEIGPQSVTFELPSGEKRVAVPGGTLR